MSVSAYNGKYVRAFTEEHSPTAMAPSVCKIPGEPAPIPVPYPNVAVSWGTSAANKQAVTWQLRSNLQSLHMAINGMCGANATQVHKALDQYADTVIKLHFAMAPMAVKVEGNQVVRRFP